MKNKVLFEGNEIVVQIPNAVKNLNVKINYIFPNPYQLVVKEVSFFTKKNLEINSVDIREVNYFSIKKKGLNLINNIANIDKDYFYKQTKNNQYMSFDLNKISKYLKTRIYENEDLKLAAYAYYYVLNNYNYATNYSLFLSKKLGYSDSYIKNLSKELFKNGYLKKNTSGTPGGIFTRKTIKLFNSPKFQQFQ
jgi:hypothetical protein